MKRDRSSQPLAALGILALIAVAAMVDRAARAPASQPPAPAPDAHRALEPGRGRGATNPLDIPWPGWKDILWRTYAQIQEDRLFAVAAGVVFYGLLAMFPALTAMVSSYGLFTDAATVGGHLAFAAAMMPAGAYDIVQDQVARIVSKSDGALGLTFFLGLGIAIWSANAGMKAMIDALNVAYDEEEKRSFVRLNLVSLAMTLGALAFLLLAVGAVIVVPLVFAWLGLEGWTESLIALARWPVLFVALAGALSLLYRFGPSRRAARWQWISVGSLVAAGLWLIGSAAFSFYLSNFGNFDATYGSLGATIGLMMWLWLSAIAVLVGAELNSEIEHQTARDSTIGRPKPLGARGAVMADTIGEASD